MKVLSKAKKASSFKPIELNIKIESLDELKELWSRINLNSNVVRNANLKCAACCPQDYGCSTQDLFDVLDSHLQEYK